MITTDTTLFSCPPDPQGRKDRELRAYALLDELGIAYLRLDHEPTPSIEACHEVDKLLGIEICKNLFLCTASHTGHCLLMMPGNKPFRTKDLSRQIGSSRLSFASPAEMEALLDLTPGSVSVLGLMNDRERKVRLLIDRDLLTQQYVGCHPCVNTASLKLRLDDLLHKFLPHTGHEPTFVEL